MFTGSGWKDELHFSKQSSNPKNEPSESSSIGTSVTIEGAKSSSLNVDLLKGTIPAFLKPLIAVVGTAVFKKAVPINLLMFKVTTFPGLVLR